LLPPPPISPKTSPGKMTLDECLELGFQHQPALAAANASLNAAYSGQRALDRLLLPRLIRRDLPQRREQGCDRVQLAVAVLTQAQWDARYAITRNFFTVQYISAQQEVIKDVLQNLDNGYKRAKKVFEAGDVKNQITQNDLDAIKIQIKMVK